MKTELSWSEYNWREFEKICYEYVQNKYSAQFYTTQLTSSVKDGGRDIIIKSRENNFEAWGECKNHKRNIDLSVIGKNIVLALSHQINEAIFFSVTPITPNTKIEILVVAQRYGFDVLFLDGESLNKEILKCESVAKKYFKKEYANYVLDNSSNLWIDTLISEFPYAEDAQNNAKTQYHLENSFKIFLHIFIKNVSLQKIEKLNIKLIDISEQIVFYENEYTWSKDLNAYSDLLYTFSGAVLSPKKLLELPQLVVSYTFSSGITEQEKVAIGTIDASDVWKAPYINSKSNLFFQTVADILKNVIPKKYARIIYIYGKSGMGKSRLMTEIENKAYENSYRVIHVDFRNPDETREMKLLLSDLLGLPHSKTSQCLEYPDFKKIYREVLEENDIEVLYEFLYENGKKVVIDKLTNVIINLLVRESYEDMILLSIDNMQELSYELQTLFWNVLEYCHKTSLSVCFVFAHNTERQIEDKNILIKYMNTCGENYENYIYSQHCEPLKEEDAIILMQNILHLTSESDNFVKKVLEKIELCPMDILLLAKSLEQISGLFQRIGEHKYVINTNSFSLNNIELPEEFSKIVNLRIDNIKKQYGNPEIIDDLLSVMIFFDGMLRMDIFQKCSFPRDLLQFTNKQLITRIDPVANNILFYHEKVYQCIKRNFGELSYTIIDILLLYYEQIENKTLKDFYYYIKVLIAKNAEKTAIELGMEQVKQFRNSSMCVNSIVNICDLLQNVIDVTKYPKEYFELIFTKADLFLERVKISDAQELFEMAKEIIITKSTFFSNEERIHFFHRYINQKLHTLQYDSALQAIDTMKKEVDMTVKASMIINDRLCVAQFSLGNEKYALKAIKKVISLAYSKKDFEWLSIAYSDKAFCHFYISKDKIAVKNNFEKAIYYYKKCKGTQPFSRKIEIEIQKAIVNILQDNYKEASANIQKANQLAEASDYSYLLNSSYNLQAFIMIILNQKDTSLVILTKALEIASTFSNSKALVSIYNNIGSIYMSNLKYEKAYARYLAAYKTLKNICKPQNSFRYLGLLGNLVKTSVLLNKSDILSEIFETYNFERLKKYRDCCQNAAREKADYQQFSIGILSFMGYDYLY